MDLNLKAAELVDTRAKQRVAAFLLDNYHSMTTAEAARIIKMPVMTVLRVMNFFEAEGLAGKRRVGTAWVWDVKKDSYAYRILEKTFKKLIKAPSVIEEIKGLIKERLKGSPAVEAKLYGSVARGDFTEGSDIDLFVVVREERDKTAFEAVEAGLNNDISDMFGRTLMSYVVSRKERKVKKNLALMKNIEKEGLSVI